jgi:hypothetical protein
MIELYREAISPPNLLYTLLLGIVLIYWLTVILGALDLDFLDFDLDTDIDVDVDLDVDVDVDMDVDTDVDVDADTDVDAGGGPGFFIQSAAFFNVGSIPFMIFLSVLFLSMWTCSVLANYYIGNAYSWFFWAFLIPNFIGSLFITKVLTMPFKSFHSKVNQEVISKKDLVGKICKVTLMASPDKSGQAEINFDDQNFRINVRSTGKESISKGSQAIIVEYDPDKNYYLISPFDI